MAEAATDHASSNGTTHDPSESPSGGSLMDVLPTDRLKEAAQALLRAAADRALDAALDRIDGLSGRLGEIAENDGVGLTRSFLGGGSGGDSEDDEDDGGDGSSGGGVSGALKNGMSMIKDKVTGALGIGSGGSGGGAASGARGKFKFMNIYETQDVGVPLRVAYDQWTQFADFPSFMKKVENVDQSSDEKITWKAQVFWSHRTWETTIVEQVPDSHILWTSSGVKGRADGFVSFGEIAPNMTKIVLILEYYPQGLFEKTGNIWRAVGRRARLEFKHFCRHVMMDSLVNRDDLEGWRGEIRDSEVVKTHEDALEEERAAAEEDEQDSADLDGADLDGVDESDDSGDDESADAFDDDSDSDDVAEDIDTADDIDDADEFDDESDEHADDRLGDVDDESDDGSSDSGEEPVPARSRRGRRTQPA